ncbi:MAG: response regulator [Tannerellaceae bacterium]|nr:response regulator [Tannerellaceae bacterium]
MNRHTVLALFLSTIMSCNDVSKPVTLLSDRHIAGSNISNQTITSFAEDAFGYIWIGTARGLNRFNGFDYYQYFNNDEDSLSLSENRICSILRDSKKNIWIATRNGINLYNSEMDCFFRPVIKGMSQNVLQILENNKGDIYANMVIQLLKYDPEKKEFNVVINFGRSDFNNTCCFDKENKLWSVTPSLIRIYESNTLELVSEIKPEQKISYSYLHADEDLWLISGKNIRILNTSNMRYKDVPNPIQSHPVLSNAIISKIHPIDENSILIDTQKNGLFLYNVANGKLIHQSETGFPFEAPDFEISEIFTDSRKNLWFGSIDQGYSIRYNYKKRFNNNNLLRSGLDKKSITSMVSDQNGNFWIATNKGVIFYNDAKRTLDKVNLDGFFPDMSYKHIITTVFVDIDNNIWFMADDILLCCRYIGGRLRLLRLFHLPNMESCIVQDVAGTIWVGQFGENLYALRKGEEQFTELQLYPQSFNITSTITTLKSGEILAGSFAKNLRIINPISWKIRKIEILPYIQQSEFIPVTLFEDSEDYIWIGTKTNGLFRYSPYDESVKNIKGLTCNDISSILEDAQGNIWIGTPYGLNKYDKTARQVSTYYAHDGIGGNQFNDRSVFKISKDILAFGGTHGITSFNPVDITFRKQMPILFEGIKVHNRLIRPGDGPIDKQLAYNPDIILKHSQNSFNISYTALDYAEYPRVRYTYIMEGFDKEWIDAQNNRQAYYSNLPSGNFIFRVRATSNDNSIPESENFLNITIKRAPWLSIPAIILYSLLVITLASLILYLSNRIRMNKLNVIHATQEKEQEKRLNRMNLSFFANISHEFRTPLTMIAGPVASLYSDRAVSPENRQLLYIIRRNVNRMLRLINQLMDFNKLENDTLKLKVQNRDIVEIIKPVIEVFNLNTKEKNIKMKTDGLDNPFYIMIDSDKLEKILGNLLSNAIKFTSSPGEISVKMNLINRVQASEKYPLTAKDTDNEYVMISVGDTGLGIPEDKLEDVFRRYYQLSDNQSFKSWGTGIGLYYSRRLVELHHGYIKAQNKMEGGCVFSFIIPVNKASYTQNERDMDEETNNLFHIPDPKEEQIYSDTNENEYDNRPTVLVVDDDTDISHYLRTLLIPYYKVVNKYAADSALLSIEEILPDLIISDVLMPGTDGYRFCQMIKENETYCHIPIILLTAKNTVKDQIEGLETGANAYVTKPFEPSYLLALIKSQLKNMEKVRKILGQTTKTEKLDEEIISPQDKAFMSNLFQFMETELSNPEINILNMADALKISRSKLYYKMKGLTGQNPKVFFRTYKLNRASELILEKHYNISEIADMTGFSTLPHFSACFKKQFGVPPSEYRKLN